LREDISQGGRAGASIERMKSLLITILAVFLAAAQRYNKFCPREKPLLDEEGKERCEKRDNRRDKCVYGDDDTDGDKCKSKPNQYKCGAFFENLTPGRELTWLEALPEALKKAKKNKINIKKVVGEEIKEKNFDNPPSCNNTYANARCYILLTKFVNEPMDSCGKNLVNTAGTGTAGDELCKQVKRFLRRDDDFKANGKRDIKIAFHYSECGGDWKPVNNNGTQLYPKEPLCCTADGKFKRCNGKDFTKSCECDDSCLENQD